jgi:hypothetical protein
VCQQKRRSECHQGASCKILSALAMKIRGEDARDWDGMCKGTGNIVRKGSHESLCPAAKQWRITVAHYEEAARPPARSIFSYSRGGASAEYGDEA